MPNYSNISVETTLAAGIDADDITLTVAAAVGYPAVPFAIIVDSGANEEVMLVTAAASTTWTVTRGYDGTTAVAHSAGVDVRHGVIAADLAALGLHEAAADPHAQYLRQTEADTLYEPAGTVATHSADTTGVHGIADTAALVLNNDTRLSDSRAPTGPASGVLSGTYPSPGFAVDMATQAEFEAHTGNTSNPHSTTAAQTGAEPALGNPATSGFVLSSTTAGVRSWVDAATQAELDSHKTSGDHDGRYYTETEVDTALSVKSNIGHTHAAGDIASGTIATARLGSGTADATTYLRGDQTWATVSAGGSVATDAIWDAVGDLAVGTGANTAARLAIGSARQVLAVNSSATGLEWAPAAVGYQPYAYPLGVENAALGTTDTWVAAGGTRLVPIVISAPMLVVSCSLRNRDTTSERSWEWRLYREPVGGGATLQEVAGLNGSETFTATAISTRTAAAATPAVIAPGLYWIAVRNTHATNTFGGAITTTTGMVATLYQLKTIGSALGSTLDATTGWSKASNHVGVALNGGVFGQSSAF